MLEPVELSKEPKSDGLPDRSGQLGDTGRIHRGWYSTYDRGSAGPRFAIQFRIGPVDRFIVYASRGQLIQLRDHLNALIGQEIAEEEMLTDTDTSEETLMDLRALITDVEGAE